MELSAIRSLPRLVEILSGIFEFRRGPMSVFQSRAWRLNWWREWGGSAGFSEVESLVGESPRTGPWLYVDRYRLKGILPIRCMQLVGSNYRRISTPRSEYGDLLDTLSVQADYEGMLQSLTRIDFTEAVFSDLLENGVFYQALERWALENKFYVRPVYRDRAYFINTMGSFDRYLTSLGKHTRLKLYNRRKIISGLGEVRVQNAWPQDVSGFFEDLNRFHRHRWGVDCFSERSRRFHRGFLNDLISEGGRPELSCLRVGNELVSVLYNVTFKGVLYNIQSGFLEGFHPKISLGLLHLGYSIEGAFKQNDIFCLDLLAGKGKNTDYKRHIATNERDLVSLMIVRSPLVTCLYKVRDGRQRRRLGSIS